MNLNSISRKVGISIISISFIALITGFLILNWYANKSEKAVFSNISASLATTVEQKLNSKKAVGISNAVSIANDGRIKKALRTNDRKWAITTLSFIGEKMKKSTPFKNIKVHVHTKDNKSFVRSWKIDKFGDDLSSFRDSVVKVNQTQTAVNTFEVGNAGLSLRSVACVTDDDGTHLGSLEFMQGLNSVAKSFNASKDAFLLLMDDKFARGEAKNKFRNYVISQKFINKEFLADANTINMQKLLKDKLYISDNYLYTYIDIKDFNEQKLGIAIVASPMSKVTHAIDSSKEMINIALIIIIVLVIFILIALMILLNKIVITPLNNFQEGLLGFFKYLNKETNNVNELTIQSKDEIGIMANIINQNIIKTKNIIEDDNKFLSEVKDIIITIKEGYLNKKLENKAQSESLEELRNHINDMLLNLQLKVCTNINDLSFALEKYAKLDFTHRIEGCNSEVTMGLNNLANIINEMLVENKSNGLTLNNSSNILLKNVDILNQNSNEAAAALEETAAAIEEITSNISNNTHHIVEMSKLASNVTDSASKGEALASQTTKAMDEIDQEVNAINEAITVIDQIAFQTNILSLNAAVEAATAGEAGKGFAVVAQEVRNLASRSADAANEIKALVENATTKSNNGKKISDEMISGYTALNENISKTIDLIKDVEMASKEQLTGIEQINDAVNSLDQQTQQNAMIASQTHDVAVDTDTIAKLIVTDADSKEFIGKNDVKAKDMTKHTTPSPSNHIHITSKETAKKPDVKSSQSKQLEPIKSSKNDDDEWASF